MTDEIDTAVELAQQLNEVSVARVRQAALAIPVGEPGECVDCGEDSPRLVHGRCAFCRDGRVG